MIVSFFRALLVAAPPGADVAREPPENLRLHRVPVRREVRPLVEL
jgi:hypothetical protein